MSGCPVHSEDTQNVFVPRAPGAELNITKPPLKTEHKLKDGLPPLPKRVARLPIDRRGFPTPWFVEWINGEPDFRVMSAERHVRAVKENRCWICGDVLGKFLVFTVGPMCGINRVSAEPPSHNECAEFAAKACPFLVMPKMVRNEHNIPAGFGPDGKEVSPENPGGIMLKRNPGVTLLWTTFSYTIIPVKPSFLCQMGDPVAVAWYAHGRAATRAEVKHSIETGLPALEDACRQEATGARQIEAFRELVRSTEAFAKYLPEV